MLPVLEEWEFRSDYIPIAEIVDGICLGRGLLPMPPDEPHSRVIRALLVNTNGTVSLEFGNQTTWFVTTPIVFHDTKRHCVYTESGGCYRLGERRRLACERCGREKVADNRWYCAAHSLRTT